MEPQTPLALPPEHKNNRKFIIIVASVFVLIALIMVAIGFVVFNNPCFEENYLGYELGPKCAYSLKPYNIESSSDVSNWKTYRNDEYGFEFKYPKDYPSKDISNGVIVLPTPENCQCDVPDGLRVYAYQSFDDFKKTKNNVLDLNMFMQENFWLFGSTTKNINAIEWTCGDQEGPGAVEMCISQNSNGNILLLYFNLQDSIKNQVLSTFKFANSITTDISNWKTYRNDEYGYEFKYPNDWFQNDWKGNPVTIQSTDFKNNLHGLGVPSEGGIWLNVNVNKCIDGDTGYLEEGLLVGVLDRIVCFDNRIQILLGLWSSDKDLQSHKKIIEDILSTFKSTK